MLGGYLWDFTRSALSLVGAIGLAWLLLRALGRRGVGPAEGPLRVLQRVSLDARSRLYVVSLGERTLLLGSADGVAPTLLAELPPELPLKPPVGTSLPNEPSESNESNEPNESVAGSAQAQMAHGSTRPPGASS